jgi:hypothetical protein
MKVFSFRRPYCICSDLRICSNDCRRHGIYVVRDEATKKCTIVDKKPTTMPTMVDNGILKTRTEAETGMKTMKVCTIN